MIERILRQEVEKRWDSRKAIIIRRTPVTAQVLHSDNFEGFLGVS